VPDNAAAATDASLQKHIAGMLARRLERGNYITIKSKRKKSR